MVGDRPNKAIKGEVSWYSPSSGVTCRWCTSVCLQPGRIDHMLKLRWDYGWATHRECRMVMLKSWSEGFFKRVKLKNLDGWESVHHHFYMSLWVWCNTTIQEHIIDAFRCSTTANIKVPSSGCSAPWVFCYSAHVGRLSNQANERHRGYATPTWWQQIIIRSLKPRKSGGPRAKPGISVTQHCPQLYSSWVRVSSAFLLSFIFQYVFIFAS